LCAAYFARYEELLPYIEWSEQSKIASFYECLKPRVKDGLAGILNKPADFCEYAKICMDLDNLAYRREQEHKKEKSGSNTTSGSSRQQSVRPTATPRAPQPTASSSTSSALPPGDPMEIDATKTGKIRGPIAPKEKQRRRDENLCLYCGGANHKIGDCPNMNEAAKKRFVAKAPTSSGKA
jgi:hypothetical protein